MSMAKIFPKRVLRKLPVDHQTVLVRADYNVPLEEDGSIGDDFRIRSSIPTLEHLLGRGCKVVIISHLGRPEGKDKKYSLRVVGTRLGELLGRPVQFVDDCIGEKVRMTVRKAPPGSVLLLENLRFYNEEESNDAVFAKKIAKDTTARFFVQDGFGVVHRAHASTSAITQWLPSAAGLLLEQEYKTITQTMKHPEHPLVAVLGGAKVSDKLPLIEALEPIAEKILVGGAMANTFLAEAGNDIGSSRLEKDQGNEIKRIYELAGKKIGHHQDVREFLLLPTDVAVADSPDEHAVRRCVGIRDVSVGDMALDIGDRTIEEYVKVIKSAKTVLWNGTMGFAEMSEFAHGSARIALALATHPKIISIIGGGDTADFVLHWDSKNGGSFTHVLKGGGGRLELMVGNKLPGIEALLSA